VRQANERNRSSADVCAQSHREVERGIRLLRGLKRFAERAPRLDQPKKRKGARVNSFDAYGTGIAANQQPIRTLTEIEATIPAVAWLIASPDLRQRKRRGNQSA
jgi:hypothetical protein